MPVARVRKIAQATAFLGPTACLSAAAVCDDGPVTVGEEVFYSGQASSQGCRPLLLWEASGHHWGRAGTKPVAS